MGCGTARPAAYPLRQSRTGEVGGTRTSPYGAHLMETLNPSQVETERAELDPERGEGATPATPSFRPPIAHEKMRIFRPHFFDALNTLGSSRLRGRIEDQRCGNSSYSLSKFVESKRRCQALERERGAPAILPSDDVFTAG
jgi:hypothetical protein